MPPLPFALHLVCSGGTGLSIIECARVPTLMATRHRIKDWEGGERVQTALCRENVTQFLSYIKLCFVGKVCSTAHLKATILSFQARLKGSTNSEADMEILHLVMFCEHLADCIQLPVRLEREGVGI